MIVPIRRVLLALTELSYLVLVLFIIIGGVNYVPLPSESNETVVFRTISEIIDNRPENMAIYLIFAVLYGSVKIILIALSLLDIDILQSELVERSIKKVSRRVRRTFITLSYISSGIAFVQIAAMVILVFVPISKVYHSHMLVAALAFVSALVKSFFFLVRRKLIYKTLSLFYISNIVYWVCFLASVILFYYYRYGLIEYLLVVLIMFENFFLVFEFYNLDFIFTVKLQKGKEEEIVEEEALYSKNRTVYKHTIMLIKKNNKT